ncbi:PREDICTED: pollen receptor-like kinase 1 [Tarenaya hassleriana]|uniref:pollen receptor-like kinase 1 n=1 Tax=Tarenaya hassleriana TaxID=28532 RepID=UPI00053C9D77|nr:PREDICTED: pollen receptor-like kinase 1 [Tarenaya hassleriana]
MEPSPLLLLLFLSLSAAASHALSETNALLNFKKSLVIGQANALASWDERNPPCKWAGVLCDRDSVWGLQMENLQLSGSIDTEALTGLPSLRTLSFMNNKFGGPLPDFKKLVSLKAIYLSHNQFEGDIPENAFEGMGWLKKVYLSDNKFSGQIPTSLAKLTKLLVLRLDGNQFTGEIPEFTGKLQKLNVANNALTGPIPESLSAMDPKVFEGNKGLCGKPLDTECPSPDLPPEPEEESKKASSKVPLIIAAVVAALAILIILGVIILLNHRNRQPPLAEDVGPSSLQKKSGIREAEVSHSGRYSPDNWSSSSAGKKTSTTAGIESTKLSFLRDDREKFDLQDLLKASAEILGSGCFGASYKAALSTGPVMVVKRFKQMNNVGREEFQEHMRRLGRLRHKNLLPLVAYYYRKEEKLLVCDYVEKGSLAVHLHGYQSLGQSGLDWPTRLKIIKGVARGMLYLCKELPGLMAPHGHLKSSNVLLSENFEPLLTDYGLIPVINQESAQELMVAYKSPEYQQHSRITKKTDVWGLGIFILEILTGKFPENFLHMGKGSEEDLASWVNTVFKGEWTPEVFDKDMGKTGHCETEILKLLRIGMSCCEMDVEKRLDIREAVDKIEELRDRDGDDDFYSTYASEADGKSSRGKSNEFINLS